MEFFAVIGFTEVVGCIDCTNIGLHDCLFGENEHTYINRKGTKSKNVQLVWDANYKIIKRSVGLAQPMTAAYCSQAS